MKRYVALILVLSTLCTLAAFATAGATDISTEPIITPAAYGGSYTPKEGDIFFTGDSSTVADHTGIVTGVTSTHIQIVDGNHNDAVCSRTLSLSNTSIIGYASPAFLNSGHIWSAVGSRYVCTICGASGGGVS